jgi:hypothetical protein
LDVAAGALTGFCVVPLIHGAVGGWQTLGAAHLGAAVVGCGILGFGVAVRALRRRAEARLPASLRADVGPTDADASRRGATRAEGAKGGGQDGRRPGSAAARRAKKDR